MKSKNFMLSKFERIKQNIKLEEIKTLKEFKEKIGDPQVNSEIRDEWNKKRLKIGKWYRYDTSSFIESYRLKRKHLHKCKLVYISSILGNYGEVIFEDSEEKEPVLLEYLIPVDAVSLKELRKVKGKKFNLFDFAEIGA